MPVSQYNDEKMKKFALLREKLNERNIRTGLKITKKPEGNARAELSLEQQRIWFLEKLSQNKSVDYHIPNILRISGVLDRDKFEQAIMAVIRKHSILRTVFKEENGKPYQIVNEDASTRMEYCKAEEENFDENDYINHQGVDFFQQELRIDRYPLFHIRLVEVSSSRYLLLLDIHHIIADGWTIHLLTKEVMDCYTDLVLGTDKYDPETPYLQYIDYADWQTANLQVYEQGLSAWKEKLADCPQETYFPWKKSQISSLEGKGAYQVFEISEEETRCLRELGKKSGATLSNILLSFYALQLLRLGNQNDVVVGLTVSGRNDFQIQNMWGLFANTIPVRFRLEKDLPFAEYLSLCSSVIYDALNYQNVPFNLIVDTLKVKRDLNINPLFQVLFTFQNREMTDLKNDLFHLEALQVDTGMAQFDLSLTFREEEDRIIGFYEYNTEVFGQEDILRYIENYQLLLQRILRSPDQSIFSVNLLSEDEEKRISEWEHGKEFLYHEESISEMFHKQVINHPERTAISCGEKTMTYEALGRRIEQDAYHIGNRIADEEKIVGIMLDSSIDLVSTILAVLQLGLAYVPLEPNTPMERVQYILNDCGIHYVVSAGQIIENYETGLPDIVFIDVNVIDHEENRVMESGKMHADGKSEIACVIYTSGTTGKPKGVMLTMDSLVNLMHSFILSYQVTEEDAMMPLTSLASSSFVGELFPMLCVGGKLALVNRETMLDTNKLIHIMNEQRITIISSVPSLLSKLKSSDKCADSLRLILSGGERFVKSDYEKLSKDAEVVNGYGITEATICSAYIIFPAGRISEFDSSCVGKPIINSNVLVLDEHRMRLPEGCVGRIYVDGKGISKGYINNPELTEKVFVNNPYNPDSVMYDTGDYGYWEDGNLYYKGRQDNQVKIRGYRIELEEIESRILEYEGVEDCACVIKNSLPEERCIACYVVIKQNYTIDGIKKFIGKRLPFYMHPSRYYSVEKIPVNANGKKDISNLAAIEMPSETVNISYMTEKQKKVYAIWKSILNAEDFDFDIDENFFEIGGHSLLMPQVQSEMEKQFGVHIEIVDLFRYSTVRLLAEYLENESKADDEVTKIIQNSMQRSEKAQRAIKNFRGGRR